MSEKSLEKRRGGGSSLRTGGIVAGYIVLAGLWIVFSDVALEGIWPEGSAPLAASIVKGLAFVVVTAVLLGLFLHRERSRFYRHTARQVATTAALLEHFRVLTARVSDAVLLVDEGGRIIEANDAAVDVFGWNHAALCKRKIDDIEVLMGIPRTGPRPVSYESVFRLADGRMMPAAVDILTLHVGSRQLRTFLVRSIATGAETAAGHRDRSWIDAFFDMPFIGMAITSPRTKRWVRFNDQLCEIFGYPRDELANLGWGEITHPDDLEADVAEFERVLRGEIDDYRLAKRFIRKDGRVIHAEIDVRTRRLPDGAVDYFVATVQDVSEHVHSEERLKRQRNLYAALLRISSAITRLPDRTQVFQEVCDAIVALGHFKAAWVFSIGPGDEEYGFEVQAGDDEGYISRVIAAPRIAEELERSEPYRAIRSGKSVVCDPYMEDPSTLPWRAIASEAHIAASGSFPILDQDRVIAVLIVYSGQTGVFDHDAILLLEELAQDIGFAIANRRREDGRLEAEETIRAYIGRLERSMLGTVDAISHMVELRDPYTAGHERRVGELAGAIAQELGLDAATCQGLEIIGRVHDIGKITIPAEILSKPGSLSEMEMNIVRTHAQQGYEILKDSEFDWPVAEVIRQHHERMDGSGYPRGLKGEEIMLEARIVAVADVVESMASHRPYRASLGIELALMEIEAQSGVLFDADVANACLRLFRERGYRLEPRDGLGPRPG